MGLVAGISILIGGLALPQSAAADGESYNFRDANTIIGEGGAFPNTITFGLRDGVYTGTHAVNCGRGVCGSLTWRIRDVKPAANGGYTGTITSEGSVKGEVKDGEIAIADPDAVGPGGGSSGGGQSQNLDDEEKPVCEASPNPMSWWICAGFNGLAELSDWIIEDIVVPFIRPSQIGLDPNDKFTGATFQIWSAFRVYGNIILVVLLLIAVFGQAIGGGLVQAYTARKMLPRILIAGIAINISIYVVAFAVDVSIIIGNGIADLITTPLVQTGEFTFNPSTEQILAINSIAAVLGAIAAFLITSGTAAAIVPFLLLFLVLPVFLAIVVIFVTLIILQATIMGLVIVSPVAFALYCLPNTERYFNLWWDWLFRALLVYPMFMTVVGISDVFTVMIQRTNGIAG
jgi:hypothetical protein